MYRAFFAICLIAGCQQSPAPDLSPLSVEQLRIKTSDADPNIRWAAVFELGRRNGQATAAITELTARLSDDHVEVRRVTTQTIGIVFMHTEPPYDQDMQAAIDAMKANKDTDETVKAGIRIALAALAAKEKCNRSRFCDRCSLVW